MKLKTLTLVDTHQFLLWAEEKYNMTNDEWHEEIWHGEMGLLYYLEDSKYTTFGRTENPETILEKHVNEFLDDFPELNGEVSFIFTD